MTVKYNGASELLCFVGVLLLLKQQMQDCIALETVLLLEYLLNAVVQILAPSRGTVALTR